MFQFVPLLGAHSSSRASSSLLLLDNGIKILVDCGWSEPFKIEDLAEIEKHASTISLILLTHATIHHIGAYAHLCHHIPHLSRIPTYATYPIASLGRSLLQDAYLSTPLIYTTHPLASDLAPLVLRTPPTSEDIDRFFDAIVSLKYSQPFTFTIPATLNGLTITAYRAGHSLGGTIWRIQHAQENVIYAVDWNHARDAHLSSAAFLPGPTGVPDEFVKPTAVICSSRNSLPGSISLPRKKRDELLLSAVRKAAFSGGIVLIPTDSAARILELAYLLEHDYRNKASGWMGSGASINLAVRTAGRTFRYVRALLEWMDDQMVKEFESVGGGRKGRGGDDRGGGRGGRGGNDKFYGPFDFRHLKLIEHKRHLMRLFAGGKGGKVIITSDKSIEWGFSTEVLKVMADGERNLVMLTEKGTGGSTAGAYLYDVWRKNVESTTGDGRPAAPGTIVKLDNVLLDMNVGISVPLSQDELVEHQEFLLAQQAGVVQPGADDQIAPAVAEEEDDVVSSSSESEDDDEDPTLQGKSLATSHANPLRKLAAAEEAAGINILLKNKGVHDYDVRNAKGRNRMFPYAPQRRKYDDYGEVVKAEDFIRAEEADVVTTSTRAGEKIEFLGGRGGGVVLNGNADAPSERIGQKRKWDKVTTTPASGANAGPSHQGGSRRNSHVSKKARHMRGPNNQNNRGRNRRDRSVTQSDSDGSSDDSGSESDDYEPEDVVGTGPSKLVINTTTVMMKTSLSFVDYEAVHDGRSLRMLLPLLKAKKVVLVAGSEEETRGLAADVGGVILELEDEKEKGKGVEKLDDRVEEAEMEIYVPRIGQVVNVSVDTDAWSVKLSDALVKALKWQNVRGLGVVHVVGRVMEIDDIKEEAGVKDEKTKDEDADVKMGDDATATEAKKQLVLDVLPTTLSSTVRSAKPIHVGDVRLADLRRVLLDTGHTAELTGEGRLLCDGVVSVVKEGVGKISIEDVGGGGGLLGSRIGGRTVGKSRFWEVRRYVYDGLARVAGS